MNSTCFFTLLHSRRCCIFLSTSSTPLSTSVAPPSTVLPSHRLYFPMSTRFSLHGVTISSEWRAATPRNTAQVPSGPTPFPTSPPHPPAAVLRPTAKCGMAASSFPFIYAKDTVHCPRFAMSTTGTPTSLRKKYSPSVGGVINQDTE